MENFDHQVQPHVAEADRSPLTKALQLVWEQMTPLCKEKAGKIHISSIDSVKYGNGYRGEEIFVQLTVSIHDSALEK